MDEMNNTQTGQTPQDNNPQENKAPSVYDQPAQSQAAPETQPQQDPQPDPQPQQNQQAQQGQQTQGQSNMYNQTPPPQGGSNMYNNPTPPQGQSTAYTHVPPQTPPELKKWNWGSFMFNIWWGIGHKVYLPLLCLIPLFGIVWVFFCGAKGNQWAWETGQYSTPAECLSHQSSWNRAGFIYFFVTIAILVLYLIIFAIAGAAIMAALGGGGYYNNYYY